MFARKRTALMILVLALVMVFAFAHSALAAPILADSYSQTNVDSPNNSLDESQSLGQSFTAVAGTLDSAEFYLGSIGEPGNTYAYLYAAGGTFGTTSVPIGPVLATSAPVNASTIGETNEWTSFHFDNTVSLVAGQHYVIAVGTVGYLVAGSDASSPTHPGNMSSANPAWTPDGTQDLAFRVYETPPVVPVSTPASSPWSLALAGLAAFGVLTFVGFRKEWQQQNA